MSAEENKAVVRRAAEAVSSGDLAAFDELMAPVVAAEFKEGIAELRQSFPDYHGADEIQVAEGDMVAGRFVFHGTHEGEFAGISPTGKHYAVEHMHWFRVADCKIAEHLVVRDDLGMRQQLEGVHT